jgi:hypothetical protein
MATFKLTIKRAQKAPDIVRAAGSSISGSDAIEVNVDVTNMTKSECSLMLDQVQRYILEHGFPA